MGRGKELFRKNTASLTEKAMAPHSGTLAWKISWTEEPGRLQSMGSLRVRHDWAISLSLKKRIKNKILERSEKDNIHQLCNTCQGQKWHDFWVLGKNVFYIGGWVSQVVLVIKNLPANAGDKRCRFDAWAKKIPWRRAWQLAPFFLPGGSLLGYRP